MVTHRKSSIRFGPDQAGEYPVEHPAPEGKDGDIIVPLSRFLQNANSPGDKLRQSIDDTGNKCSFRFGQGEHRSPG